MDYHDYDYEGCKRLAVAIVEQAAKDYRKALQQNKKNPKNHQAIKEIKDCERFFKSNRIGILTDVDGTWLMNKIREEESI